MLTSAGFTVSGETTAAGERCAVIAFTTPELVDEYVLDETSTNDLVADLLAAIHLKEHR